MLLGDLWTTFVQDALELEGEDFTQASIQQFEADRIELTAGFTQAVSGV